MPQTNIHVLSGSKGRSSQPTIHLLKALFPALLLVLALLAVIVTDASLASASEPWSQWRGGKQHLGFSEGAIPQEDVLCWKYRTEGQVQSSPVFYHGGMLIGSDDGWLYCFEPASGELLWKFNANRSVQATPLVMDNRTYFGSLEGIFYCLDLPDPDDEPIYAQEVWRYTCGDSIASSAHAFQESVVFGCHDGYLYRLSLDGDLIWKGDIEGDAWASPLIDEVNGRAYIGNIFGNFSCIDLDDGNVTWSINAGEIYSSGCLVDDTIFLCSGDGSMRSINADNGSIIWTFEIGYSAHSTPSFYDGFVYFGSYEYAWCLPAVDPNLDGEIDASEVIWSTPTHDFDGGSSPLISDDYVFIGSTDGNIYCLDRGDGTVVWNFTTGGFIYSSPVLFNSLIFFGSCDRYVYCVGSRPTGLSVLLETGVPEIASDDTLQINITVIDPNGTVVEGAVLHIVLSAGEIEVISGGDVVGGEDQVLTGTNGRAEILFTPPPVSSRSTIEIIVNAEKTGIEPGEATIYIVVEPGKDTASDAPSRAIDPNEKRMPYYLLLIVIIIINLILGFVILMMRSTRSKKHSTRDAPRKGGQIHERK